MNQNSSSHWSPMISGQEDFDHLLDFSDLQLDYAAFNASENPPQHGHVDFEMENDASIVDLKEGDMQQDIDHNLMNMVTGLHEMDQGSTDSLLDLELQAQFFHPQSHHEYHSQQHSHAHYRSRHQVPPTPTSLEMNGVNPQTYSLVESQPRVTYDAYSGKQQNHLMFTPLVSPAVTPLETQIRMPGYSTPREYFSPLTSPALEAQHHGGHRSVYGPFRGSDASDTTSPIEKTDHSTGGAIGNASGMRRSKRKSMSLSSKPSARAVRSSPAMKPQRKKQLSTSVIPSKELAEMIEDARASKQTGRPHSESGKLSLPESQYSSEAGSISPEPLSDIMMPPPAPPGSLGRSPYLKAQGEPQPSSMRNVMNAPATPASLMKIKKKAQEENPETSNGSGQRVPLEGSTEQPMEDILLPGPAATSIAKLPPLDTNVVHDDQATPTISAKRPLSSVSTPVSSAILPSPSIFTMPSPSGLILSKRGDLKVTARRGSKRNSSSHVSPALRPKMSPNIKPLLPEGTLLTAETSALLLASKSNYQNILEGTHLPGVEYPDALSENLTSKRTSHKLAEQGRRNRINNALQEMAALLPAGGTPATNGREGSSGEGAAGAGVGSSKANTVEVAIEYIKSLQSELKDMKSKLEETEKKLSEACKAGKEGEEVMA